MTAPIQHGRKTTQFTCSCGHVVTFSQVSDLYPRLVNYTYIAETKVVRGECPFCGQAHWWGYRAAFDREFEKAKVKEK